MATMRYRIDRRRALGLLGSTVASTLVPLPGARVRAQALDKVSYQTNWRAQAEHGGFYYAAVNGIYKKYGIDAEIRPGGPQQNPSQLLLGGRVDMIMSNSFEAIRYAQEGIPPETLFEIVSRISYDLSMISTPLTAQVPEVHYGLRVVK